MHSRLGLFQVPWNLVDFRVGCRLLAPSKRMDLIHCYRYRVRALDAILVVANEYGLGNLQVPFQREIWICQYLYVTRVYRVWSLVVVALGVVL